MYREKRKKGKKIDKFEDKLSNLMIIIMMEMNAANSD